MVVIRLSRGGAKKRPFYHVVVADRRSPRDGRNIERLGYFNPIAKGGEIRVHMNLERVDYWISSGAQPSERVLFLLKQYRQTAGQVGSQTPKATRKVSAPASEEATAEATAAEKPAAKKAKTTATKETVRKTTAKKKTEAKDAE